MKYKKVFIYFKNCEKNRFYRTLLAKSDLNLLNFGCAIVTAFGGSLEHYFLFKDVEEYLSKVLLRYKQGKIVDDYCIDDLSDKFEFVYDLKSKWKFKCEIVEELEHISNKDVLLLDGKGQGIWEDRLHTFLAYLAGKLNPNSLEENEEEKYFKPWNKRLSKYSDFETAYNLEDEQDLFPSSYACDVEMYKAQIDRTFGICRYA